MELEIKQFTLTDGIEGIVRNVKSEDAERMLAFLKDVSGETEFLLRYPEEYKLTVEQEKSFLEEIEKSENQVMITAFIDGEIAGNASISPIGYCMKLSHRANFAIAIRKKYWHKGLGTLLMEEALKAAKEAGYEQVELGVYHDNPRARAMYERFGFEEWGIMKQAFKMKDGSYRDEIMMGKVI